MPVPDTGREANPHAGTAWLPPPALQPARSLLTLVTRPLRTQAEAASTGITSGLKGPRPICPSDVSPSIPRLSGTEGGPLDEWRSCQGKGTEAVPLS